VAGWQPGQLAAPVGFGAGMDFEQPEHPDHHIGVNLHRPAGVWRGDVEADPDPWRHQQTSPAPTRR
jgi:hypothetical protein